MPDRPGNARTGLLSLIMLGVLLASTAAAWWLCQGRGTQRRLAGELLREIQAGGLDRHWADSPDLRWFLGVSGGRPVAWRAYSRKRQDQDWNGVILARTSRLLAHADWTLSQDARTGRYVAVYGGGGSHATTVRLEAGTLIVEERSGPVVRTAASPAPENYLPEGLL